MAKFQFTICTSCEMIGDRRGRTMDDLSKAVELASRYARLLSVKARYAHIDFKVIEIRDERGGLLQTVRFCDANPSSSLYDPTAIETPVWKITSTPIESSLQRSVALRQRATRKRARAAVVVAS